MTNDIIEKFIDTKAQKNGKVTIYFKQRATIKGMFIRTNDFDELKAKNFWRIVSEAKVEEFVKTKDSSLARIYNGAEFTRLSETAQ